jgi:hypothetical protein
MTEGTFNWGEPLEWTVVNDYFGAKSKVLADSYYRISVYLKNTDEIELSILGSDGRLMDGIVSQFEYKTLEAAKLVCQVCENCLRARTVNSTIPELERFL